MYATDNENCCPVYLLKLLVSKTIQNATNLFNQYMKEILHHPDIWYSAKPLQKCIFRKFLGEICIAAGVEHRYLTVYRPPQSLTLMFEARHIMFMLRHRNYSTLRSYNRSLSWKQNECISFTLSLVASASSSSRSTIVALLLPSTRFSNLPPRTP